MPIDNNPYVIDSIVFGNDTVEILFIAADELDRERKTGITLTQRVVIEPARVSDETQQALAELIEDACALLTSALTDRRAPPDVIRR